MSKILGEIELINGSFSANLSANTSGELIISPGGTKGYAGLGTTNPNGVLHIKQTNNTLGEGQLLLDALAFGAQYEATIMFGHAGNVRGIFGFQNEVGKMHLKRSVGNKAFSASTNNSAMSWDLNGDNLNRVGINNESPLAILDVNAGDAGGTTAMIIKGGSDLSTNDALQIKDSGNTINHIFQNDGGIIFNEAGNSADFRIESDNEANMLFLDGSANQIGIGGPTLNARLHIQGAGSTSATNSLIIENASGTDILTIRDDSRMIYVDGNQADGYILTSDSGGTATWQAAAGGGIATYAETLVTPSAGVTNTITHNLGTTDIIVQLWEDTGDVVTALITNRTTTDVDVEFAVAPGSNIRVIVQG